MTDLRDVIARAIFLVDYMSIGEESWETAALDGNDDRRQAFEKADAVLAVLSDHDAKVRAEALRDARAALDEWADELSLVLGEESDEGSWIEMPLGEWLGFRADWIEQGEQNA